MHLANPMRYLTIVAFALISVSILNATDRYYADIDVRSLSGRYETESDVDLRQFLFDLVANEDELCKLFLEKYATPNILHTSEVLLEE